MAALLFQPDDKLNAFVIEGSRAPIPIAARIVGHRDSKHILNRSGSELA
jgi:hypothetical protein